jgi:hypothetical protein
VKSLISPISKVDWEGITLLSDFLVATGLALIFLLCSLWGRTASAGNPFNTFKKGSLIYGFTFVLRMGNIMVLVADLKSPRTLLFPAIGCWGVVLGFAAWLRHKRQTRDSDAAQR